MRGPSIVILTGAGISAESGVRTFRGSDGLWRTHRIEDVASPLAFKRNPALVHEFYNERRAQLLSSEVKPNAAHYALAKLEQLWPTNGRFLLVSQNVDHLHETSGSNLLVKMHGDLLKARCSRSGQVFNWCEDITITTPCPCCERVKVLRPHIVWFSETPFRMKEISEALDRCHIFIVIGTSGSVYPAAGFVEEVRPGTRTIEVNLEGTEISGKFSEHRFGKASEVVPKLIDELLLDNM